MTNHLVQIHNMRFSYPNKVILLFDYDASGAFLHAKLYPQDAVANVCSFGQTLCMPVSPVFGTNFSPHKWEFFAQSLCKKMEHF